MNEIFTFEDEYTDIVKSSMHASSFRMSTKSGVHELIYEENNKFGNKISFKLIMGIEEVTKLKG